MKRDFLSINDISPTETHQIIQRAKTLKEHHANLSLGGKTIALLFEKPSLRTKVSFQVGIHQLNGYSLYLSPDEVGLGSREPVYDVAKVLSGYVDCIIARVFSHQTLLDLAKYASVPIINALSFNIGTLLVIKLFFNSPFTNTSKFLLLRETTKWTQS